MSATQATDTEAVDPHAVGKSHLQVQNITKFYGDEWDRQQVISDLSLDITSAHITSSKPPPST